MNNRITEPSAEIARLSELEMSYPAVAKLIELLIQMYHDSGGRSEYACKVFVTNSLMQLGILPDEPATLEYMTDDD